MSADHIQNRDQSETALKTARKTADAVIPLLRSTGYNREPSFAQGWSNKGNVIQEIITEHILVGRPVPFVGFWGVGDKEALNVADLTYIGELATLSTNITKVYSPGIDITILLADEHARFNAKPENQVVSYLNQVGAQLSAEGIHPVWLSLLYKKHGLEVPNVFQEQTSTVAQQIYEGAKERVQQTLLNAAGTHNGSNLPPKHIALHYLSMRLQEQTLFATDFLNALIMVNASGELGGIIMPSEAPVLYKHGTPAWFR